MTMDYEQPASNTHSNPKSFQAQAIVVEDRRQGTDTDVNHHHHPRPSSVGHGFEPDPWHEEHGEGFLNFRTLTLLCDITADSILGQCRAHRNCLINGRC